MIERINQIIAVTKQHWEVLEREDKLNEEVQKCQQQKQRKPKLRPKGSTAGRKSARSCRWAVKRGDKEY